MYEGLCGCGGGFGGGWVYVSGCHQIISGQ